MPSSTSNSEAEFTRVIPAAPWKAVATAVALLTTLATVAWEIHARASGYAPSLNDTPDLWAEQRAKVRPDSLVLLGTSRLLFDADLDTLEQALGQRPVQLALAGGSPFPLLADLAAERSFHGTIILDVVPLLFFAPPGSPPMEVAQKALVRRRDWNYAQKWSHRLGLLLEERVAFLKQEDLTLGQLLLRVPLPDRPNARIGPALPPYFYTIDRDRRGRMIAEAAIVGSPLQQRVAAGWLPLFTPPPPPSFIPAGQFQAMMAQAVEQRFKDAGRHIATLRARGAKVVFLRLPVTSPLVDEEEKAMPLAHSWTRLIAENDVPAVNFADHPDLNSFDCPEWSHLSAPDSIQFTQRLVPHLQNALAREKQRIARISGASTPGSP
jgi:hypothetical protein